ncbi:unnamed protein product [Owenia fusiformis]|uniref:DUF7164 domain-containing protein n=1 Tax=Owenia fusiformis TaxID=6347 RepID=A0A8J1UWA4_OWEFU|nr:unnamed protein product [Owenia fusiformis]
MPVKIFNGMNCGYILLGFILSSSLWISLAPINWKRKVGLNCEKTLESNLTSGDTHVEHLKIVETLRKSNNPITEKVPSRNISGKDKPSLHNALLMYVDSGDQHIIQFTVFLYASWKYVMMHKYLKQNIAIDNAEHVPDMIFDLLVYCHPEICKFLPLDCLPVIMDKYLENVPNCWYIPSDRVQNHEGYPPDYCYINTFTFLIDANFGQIANRYDWIMRTDTDVFISPAILGWLSKYPLITGIGGYGVPFSEGLGGLFNVSEDGEWPYWWRQVSTMYGSELAINHIIPNLTEDHKAVGYMDLASSDNVTSVMKAPHIHCWQGPEEFDKLEFTAKIVGHIQGDVRKLWLH